MITDVMEDGGWTNLGTVQKYLRLARYRTATPFPTGAAVALDAEARIRSGDAFSGRSRDRTYDFDRVKVALYR